MYNYAPQDYVCPICLGVKGVENDNTLIRQSDIVYKDDVVIVFVASYFIETCEGHLIVVPVKHHENLYDLPDEVGAQIFKVARKMAVMMRKAYDCEGVTTLQNNEPAGNQHAFHYHLHLFPRYEGDNLHGNMMSKRETTEDERHKYSTKIIQQLVKEEKHG